MSTPLTPATYLPLSARTLQASSITGHLSQGLRSIAAIIAVGASCQALVLAGLLFFSSGGHVRGSMGALLGAAMLWGVGDAALNTQLSSLLPILKPHQTVAAFAQWKVWQSGASALTFFAGPHTSLTLKLLVLSATLAAALIPFFRVTLQKGPQAVLRAPH